MKQFLLRDEPDEGKPVRLSGNDFHYLAHVRRVRVGDAFDCRAPSGKPAVLRVICVEKDVILAEYTPKTCETSSQTAFPSIILFQSMTKGAKMDIIIRQAAEAGVTEVVPFYSEHSLPRNVSGVLSVETERIGRWRRVLKEACQQSGSATATTAAPPKTFDEILKYWEHLKSRTEKTLGLLVHEIPLEKGGFHRYLNTIPELVVLVVGPEGGFSPSEAGAFVEAGFKPVILGDTILRSESAAFYSIAVVRTLIYERLTWTATNQ
ncbi:MAG: RsmE family RNA methyltransferase [Treponema sp.]|jgi:16S rRNA (uracil1498-N3)-methyltransferase|nr:RsmE family RNA methyltransferase [Treponema sp.]